MRARRIEAVEALPVAEGRNEVEAAVHPVVQNVLAVDAALVGEVLATLLVDVRAARTPALVAVYCVAESCTPNRTSTIYSLDLGMQFGS